MFLHEHRKINRSCLGRVVTVSDDGWAEPLLRRLIDHMTCLQVFTVVGARWPVENLEVLTPEDPKGRVVSRVIGVSSSFTQAKKHSVVVHF